MPVSQKNAGVGKAPNRRAPYEIPYSVAFNQYTYSSQNCALSALDSFITGLNGAASIGIWFKGKDLASIPAYIFGANPAAGGTYCFIGLNRTSGNLGKINWQLRDNGGDALGIQCNKFVLNGNWHLVVFTKDATNTPGGMKVYVDGVLQSQTTISAAAFNDPAVIGRSAMIGSTSASANFFKGFLSQLGLWQRELTATEVQNWYDRGNLPASYHRFYSADRPITTEFTELAAAEHGTLDSVNMWSEDGPRGVRKPSNLFN